ncbi:MAG: hypothetical protein WB756_14465, partial [Xanthobacteraceae bacterium]
MALFERRPPERVDSSSLPASENLHIAHNRTRALQQTESFDHLVGAQLEFAAYRKPKRLRRLE